MTTVPTTGPRRTGYTLVHWALTRTVLPCTLLAVLSAWHAVRQIPSDVHSYRLWVSGPLPSWRISGPYPVVADFVWWPLRYYHGFNINPVWVLGWTGPATVIACIILWHSARRPVLAVNLWLLGAAILERSYWVRLDPIAAVIALAAVVGLRRARPAASGALLAVGALVKVWPGFFLPWALLITRGRSRWTWIGWFALPWTVFGILVAALRPHGAMTWFTFALTRRIQLESLTALVPEWAMALGSHTWHTGYRGGLDSANLVLGPHMPTTHHILDLVAVVALAVLALRIWRWWRASETDLASIDPDSYDLFAYTAQLVFLLILIFSGPVFSPQYLVWFAPLLVVAAGDGLLGRETGVWLVACGLTTIEYPYLWDEITSPRWYAVLDLTLRDIVLFVLFVMCLRTLWALTRPAGPPAAARVPARLPSGRA